jgi:hypothetical protein
MWCLRRVYYIKCLNHLGVICGIEGGVYDNIEMNRKFRKEFWNIKKALGVRKLRTPNKEHETLNDNIFISLTKFII